MVVRHPVRVSKSHYEEWHSPPAEGSGTFSQDWPSPPFFHAKKIGDQIVTRGTLACELGHTLSRHDQQEEGVFVHWNWDGKRLTVTNDKYGFYPCFYYCQDHEIGLSPSILPLVSLLPSKEFHDAALAVFFRLGFFLGDTTPFFHVKALPPGAVLEWEDGRLMLTSRQIPARRLPISRKEATERFIELFHQAIKKRLPPDGNFVVPLSSGRDSRHILLALHQLGYRPKFCVTHEQFPNRPQEDARVIRLLTDTLRVAHVVLPQNQSRFQNERRKNLITSFCSNTHAQTLVTADYLHRKASLIYDGVAGNLTEGAFLMKPEYVQLHRQGRYEPLAMALIHRLGTREEVLKRILNPDVLERMSLAVAKERIVEELQRHAHTPHPLRSFDFWNRTRRNIGLSPYAILARLPVYSPYLDDELCDFLLSLPMEIIEDETFHTEAIQQAFPQFACIPFGEKKDKGAGIEEHLRLFNKEFVRFHLSHATTVRSSLLNVGFILPRLLRCLVDSRYLASSSWLSCSPMTYVLQLEELVRRGNQFRSADQTVRWTSTEIEA